MESLTKLYITNIITETPEVKTFFFDKKLPYKAGQYLTFVTQHYGREIRRSYSIASSPALAEPLSITVKRIDNGILSRKLIDDTQPGAMLETTGSAGFFTLPEQMQPVRHLFFFAAGSGIVPVFSLIKTALYRYPNVHIILAYSNRSEKDTIYYQQLMSLSERFASQLDIVFLFSINPDLANARLTKETLQLLLKRFPHDPDHALYYLCGPFAYMRNTFIALEEKGIAAKRIRKENFNTERTVLMAVPEDKQSHKIRFHYGNHHYEFMAGYPDPILKAAKTAGLELPYSCETGRCGSCAARCVSGQVWMSNNEVLTDKELQKGLVLTCTGYPQHGDVQLEIV